MLSAISVRAALGTLGCFLFLALLADHAVGAEPAVDLPADAHQQPEAAGATPEGENERPLFIVGGHLELDFESETNYNLDDGDGRDVATLELEVNLTF